MLFQFSPAATDDELREVRQILDQFTRPAARSIVVRSRKRQFAAFGCGYGFRVNLTRDVEEKLSRWLVTGNGNTAAGIGRPRRYCRFSCFFARDVSAPASERGRVTEDQCFLLRACTDAERKFASSAVRVRHRQRLKVGGFMQTGRPAGFKNATAQLQLCYSWCKGQRGRHNLILLTQSTCVMSDRTLASPPFTLIVTSLMSSKSISPRSESSISLVATLRNSTDARFPLKEMRLPASVKPRELKPSPDNFPFMSWMSPSTRGVATFQKEKRFRSKCRWKIAG